MLYNQLNFSLLYLLGIKINLPKFSDEKVNRAKSLFFGLSSDLLYSNYENFILFTVNVVMILILNGLLQNVIKK